MTLPWPDWSEERWKEELKKLGRKDDTEKSVSKGPIIAAMHGYRQLGSIGQAAQARRERVGGRDYLVVPTVALKGDAVVRPMNSRGPEFVPASALSRDPDAWNGRPIMQNHPDGGLSPSSAPGVMQKHCFGYMANTRFEDGLLKTDAWFDLKRAEEVGPEAQDVVRRALAGELIDVSVGAFVAAEERKGFHNGAAYQYVWNSVTPDHLAFLPVGMPGACSVDMGCGAPRFLAAACACGGKKHSVEHPAPASNEEGQAMSSNKAKELVGRLLTSKPNIFGEECREHLEAFGEDRLQALADLVALADKPVPPFIKKKMDEKETEEEDATETETDEEKEKKALASLSKGTRELIERYKAREAEERNQLISALSGAQKVFSEDQLKSKPTEELHSLAQLLNLSEPAPADYSGRGSATVTAAAGTQKASPAPRPYTAALAKLRGETPSAN